MSKPEQSSLMKTCSICGLQKPLAAFLQYSGASGATYGNVCATCRKTEAEKAKKPKAEEDSTTSKTTRTIDAKTRVKSEADKRQEQKEVSEEYYEEREEKDVEKVEKSEKTQTLVKEEKKQRERSFLNRPYQSVKTETTPRTFAAAQNAETAVRQTIAKDEAGKQAEATKADVEAKEINTSTTMLPPQTGGMVKYQGEFRKFIARLGDSPIGRAFAQAERAAHAANKAGAQPASDAKAGATNKTASDAKAGNANKTASKDADASSETLAERVEKSWSPRRR